jgi:hypothetical protein
MCMKPKGDVTEAYKADSIDVKKDTVEVFASRYDSETGDTRSEVFRYRYAQADEPLRYYDGQMSHSDDNGERILQVRTENDTATVTHAFYISSECALRDVRRVMPVLQKYRDMPVQTLKR